MAEPKRTISDIRNRERAKDDFILDGYSDVDWEMVSIQWVDAESDGGSGWQDPEEMMEYARRPLPVIHTVGLLVYEDAEQIAVTDSKGPEEMGSVTKIPPVGQAISPARAVGQQAGRHGSAIGVFTRSATSGVTHGVGARRRASGPVLMVNHP